jgi:dihydrofolate reductase
LVPYFDDMMGNVMTEWIQGADGVLLGRKTYEIFAAHWPYVTGDVAIAAKLNSVRKYVVSRTLLASSPPPKKRSCLFEHRAVGVGMLRLRHEL